jgi:beta-N-acetylhexosaminidase
VDHNGHPVPDGTGVKFKIAVIGAGGVVQQIDSITTQGVARASFSIDRPGLLEISATSDPAISSVVIQLTVTSEGSSVTVVTPTPIPEFTATPTIFIPTPTVTVTYTPLEQGYPGFTGWFAMVLLLSISGLMAYWFGLRLAGMGWGVRWAICVILGGVAAYTYLAIRLPGAAKYLHKGGWPGMLEVVLLGAAAGFVSASAWFRLARVSGRRSD